MHHVGCMPAMNPTVGYGGLNHVGFRPAVYPTWYTARAAGFEPVTSSVTGKRSNQLSYARKYTIVVPILLPSGQNEKPRDAGLSPILLPYSGIISFQVGMGFWTFTVLVALQA